MELEGYESPFVGADPIDDGDDMELPPEWVEDTDAAPPENPEGVEDEGGEEAASPGEGEGVEGAPDTEEDPEGDEGAPDTEEDPEEDAPRNSQHRVPKARLDKEIQKRRVAEQERQVAEQELEALRRQLDRTPPTQDPGAGQEPAAEDPSTLMVEAYAEALNMALDGDVAGASARMMEAQAKREEQLRAQLTSEVQQHSTRRQLQQELDLVTEALEAQFEDLRPGSENYNAELVDDIIAVRDGLMAGRSLRPGQALERAAQLVLADRFVGSTGVDEPAPTPPSKPKSLQKQVDAANRQAPSTAGRGADTSGDYQKVDVFTMSEEDFENLSEAELRRLRGDFG